MKKHIHRFWRSARRVGKDAIEDLADKASKEGPQQYLQRKKESEKKASELIPGGKADGKPDSDFDKRQIRMGVKVEKEHIKDPKARKEIAKDHLTEDPKYYSHLKKMEDKYVVKKAFWEGFFGE